MGPFITSSQQMNRTTVHLLNNSTISSFATRWMDAAAFVALAVIVSSVLTTSTCAGRNACSTTAVLRCNNIQTSNSSSHQSSHACLIYAVCANKLANKLGCGWLHVQTTAIKRQGLNTEAVSKRYCHNKQYCYVNRLECCCTIIMCSNILDNEPLGQAMYLYDIQFN